MFSDRLEIAVTNASLTVPDVEFGLLKSMLDTQEILHLGFAVDSIPEAVDFFAKSLGAGPFYVVENVVFDELEYEGAEVPVWDHSTCLGAWGNQIIELQEMHRIEPAPLEAKLGGINRLNHIGYIAGDFAEESARLESLGLPKYLRIRANLIECFLHEIPVLGMSVEIHKDTEFIRDAHRMFFEAADGWDGSTPLRPMPMGDDH